ncbi:MAG: hypothetical protein ACFUZC_08700 [Chthoniobacteraceae bacterium]
MPVPIWVEDEARFGHQPVAGFHLEEGNQLLPKNVRVIALAPYSSELNSKEQLWDIAKDRICSRVWDDLEELQDAINGDLKEYWSNPARIRSLLGNHSSIAKRTIPS